MTKLEPTLKHPFFRVKPSGKSSPFIQISKVIIESEEYSCLKSEAILAYGLLCDRMKLSFEFEKSFSDENGFFVYFKIDELAKLIRTGRDGAMKVLKALDSVYGVGLIHRVRQGLGKPDKIYVLDIFSEMQAENDCLNESDFSSRSRKTRHQEIERHTRHYRHTKSFIYKNNNNNQSIKTDDDIDHKEADFSDSKGIFEEQEMRISKIEDMLSLDEFQNPVSENLQSTIHSLVKTQDEKYLPRLEEEISKRADKKEELKKFVEQCAYVVEKRNSKNNSSSIENLGMYALTVLLNGFAEGDRFIKNSKNVYFLEGYTRSGKDYNSMVMSEFLNQMSQYG